MRDFLAIYEPEVQKSGDIGAAWQAVQAAQDARLAAEKAAIEREGRRQRRFYWMARGLQVVGSIPVVGGWIVTLIVPVIVLLPFVWFGIIGDENQASFLVIYSVTTTIWLIYLDLRGIVRVTLPIPFVAIPAWPVFVIFTLATLSQAC